MKQKLNSNIKLKLEKISDEFKKRRKYLGITQLKLSKISNLSQSIIAKLEANKIDPNLSTILKIENALELEEKSSNLKASEIMVKNIASVKSNVKIFEVIELMTQNDFSQVLVYNRLGKLIGCLYEKTMLGLISKKIDIYNISIKEYVENLPIIVSKDYSCGDLFYIFQNRKTEVVLVGNLGEIEGIISKSDLFKK